MNPSPLADDLEAAVKQQAMLLLFRNALPAQLALAVVAMLIAAGNVLFGAPLWWGIGWAMLMLVIAVGRTALVLRYFARAQWPKRRGGIAASWPARCWPGWAGASAR